MLEILHNDDKKRKSVLREPRRHVAENSGVAPHILNLDTQIEPHAQTALSSKKELQSSFKRGLDRIQSQPGRSREELRPLPLPEIKK